MSNPLSGGASSTGYNSCMTIPSERVAVIKTQQDYIKYVNKFVPDTGIIFLNGHVIQTWLALNKNNVATSKRIHQILTAKGHECTATAIGTNITRLNRELQIYKKSIHKNWHKIKELLNLPFKVPVLKKKATILEAVISQENVETPKDAQEMQLKRDCEKCPVLRKTFMQTIFDLKSKLRASKKIIRDMSKRFDVKRVNQNLKRNAATRDKLRHEKFVLRKENLKLKKKMDYLKAKLEAAPQQEKKTVKAEYSIKKEKTIITLKNQMKEKEEVIKSLDWQVCSLTNSLKELEAQSMSRKIGDSDMEPKRKKYNASIRKCMYMCLSNQVPIHKSGLIIEFVSRELCGIQMSSVPGPSTASLMAYEMGVISDLQIGELLFQAQDGTATISWDATTKDGCHVNECHVAVGGQQLTMKLASLASGKTDSYVKQITQSLQNLATTFAVYKKLQQQVVMFKFKNCLASTLTDRAAVNHCISKELSEFLGAELVELNCHVHPLDGLASQARKILKKHDEDCNITSALYGCEGKAANLLYSISKLRWVLA